MPPMGSRFRPVIPGLRTTAAKLAVAMVAWSIIAALLAKSDHPDLLPLTPSLVRGYAHAWAPWQPLTYVFLAQSPMEVIFGGLILWSLGGALEARWGAKRLILFAVGVTVLAAILTVAFSVPLSSLGHLSYGGARVMTSALWVAYGLSLGRAQVNFWGLPVNGYGFAAIGVGFTVLNGLMGSWQAVVPEVCGLALTFAYVDGWSPRILWLRLQNWRLQRTLRGRAKHLRLVAKDRNTPSDSDTYLH